MMAATASLPCTAPVRQSVRQTVRQTARRCVITSVARPTVAVAAPPMPPPTLQRPEAPELDAAPPAPASGDGGDPWADPKWTGLQWTVYRGVAYDLTSFMKRHPAGSWLLNLAVGRDCTALFESYHLRPEVAVSRLRMLPVLGAFPVAAVPRAPYPNDSEIYNSIRERVRREVFGGQQPGSHRTGSEGAAAVILGYAAAAYAVYLASPGLLTGFLLGLGGAWIGLTVQHCGNHGAMSTNPFVNNAMGLCDDLIGGSSLCWRYHHQVSHHIHCNDEALDEDVMSAFPLLRFDPRLPRVWYHKYQHIYMWALFPLLQLGFQASDLKALFERKTVGARMYGATATELATIALGKLAHYGLLIALPWALHGGEAAAWGTAAYAVTQSIVLAATFAVSHNVPETKSLDAGPALDNLHTELATRDWGVQQIVTSANWGGAVGNFFTGGLNLQVEHHLFPAVSFAHYPAIAAIVEEEAVKRGVQYAKYDTLPEILSRFMRFMREVGEAEQVPMPSKHAGDLARL